MQFDEQYFVRSLYPTAGVIMSTGIFLSNGGYAYPGKGYSVNFSRVGLCVSWQGL